MAARALRAVSEDEKPPTKKPPRTLLEAVDAGNYLAELRLTHKRIAKAVADPNTSPRDLAALTRRQLEISKELVELRAADEGDEVAEAGDTPDEEWTSS